MLVHIDMPTKGPSRRRMKIFKISMRRSERWTNSMWSKNWTQLRTFLIRILEDINSLQLLENLVFTATVFLISIFIRRTARAWISAPSATIRASTLETEVKTLVIDAKARLEVASSPIISKFQSPHLTTLPVPTKWPSKSKSKAWNWTPSRMLPMEVQANSRITITIRIIKACVTIRQLAELKIELKKWKQRSECLFRRVHNQPDLQFKRNEDARFQSRLRVQIMIQLWLTFWLLQEQLSPVLEYRTFSKCNKFKQYWKANQSLQLASCSPTKTTGSTPSTTTISASLCSIKRTQLLT